MAITYPRHLTAAKCIKTKKDVSNFDITSKPIEPYYSTTVDRYKPFCLLTEIGLYDNVVQTSEEDMEKTITTFQVPAGWRRPKTHFMDAHWKTGLSKMVEERLSEMGSERAGHEELILRLLAIGGDGVAIEYEEDLDQILEKATVCKGRKARKMRGRPCNCHRNSAQLYRNNKKDVRVATGWALSPDGCWRQHSWVVEPLVNWDNSGYQVIETTVRRVVYYGFMLTEEECEKFYYGQT